MINNTTLPTTIPEVLEYITTNTGRHSVRNRLLYRMRPYWGSAELSQMKIGEVLNPDGTIRTHYENEGRRIEFSPDFQREVECYLRWRFNLTPYMNLDRLAPHLWDNLFSTQKGSRMTNAPKAFSPDGNTLRNLYASLDRTLRQAFSQHQPA